MGNNVDLSVCIDEADWFLYVAEKINNLNDIICGGMYPFVVNMAFACELYIKAILIYKSNNNKIEKSHDLKKLFETLPIDVQSNIKTIFSEKSDGDLEIILPEINTAFVDWRYAYEKNVSANLSDIQKFAESLKEYANENIQK